MSTLQDWTDRLTGELGLDQAVDVTLVLDLARDVAHEVARPAAPLTAFIVGLVAGRDGLTAPDLQTLVERVGELARTWPGRPGDLPGEAPGAAGTD